jgi:hypothetical protein
MVLIEGMSMMFLGSTRGENTSHYTYVTKIQI